MYVYYIYIYKYRWVTHPPSKICANRLYNDCVQAAVLFSDAMRESPMTSKHGGQHALTNAAKEAGNPEDSLFCII